MVSQIKHHWITAEHVWLVEIMHFIHDSMHVCVLTFLFLIANNMITLTSCKMCYQS